MAAHTRIFVWQQNCFHSVTGDRWFGGLSTADCISACSVASPITTPHRSPCTAAPPIMDKNFVYGCIAASLTISIGLFLSNRSNPQTQTPRQQSESREELREWLKKQVVTNAKTQTSLIKSKHKLAHMKSAFNYAACSTAKRLQVGCVLVKDNRIISIGYNGMPSGWTNECETKENVTKPEVLHAETNAIAKLARCSESGEGATAFVTHQPCMDCAKLLYQSGIEEVYFCEPYRLKEGVDFLKKCKITVEQMSIS